MLRYISGIRQSAVEDNSNGLSSKQKTIQLIISLLTLLLSVMRITVPKQYESQSSLKLHITYTDI